MDPAARKFDASDITVVIPTRDRWHILAKTLDALRAQTIQGFEVIAVADGTDQQPPDLGVRTLIRKHGGPGAARNAGVRATGRPLVLFLGDDMIPTARVVELHLKRHQENPEPSAAVLGRVEWHPDVPRDRLHRWLDWSGMQFDFASIQGNHAGWGRFYSCNVSLKRAFFLDTGGFDEDFTFDYEDLDLAYRLSQKGLHLLFESDAVVQHLHPYDWRRVQQRWESRAGAERLMASKHAWFSPYFGERVRQAAEQPRVSRAWTILADIVPSSAGRIHHVARARAHRWYQQQLAPAYQRVWDADAELEDLRSYLGDAYDHSKLVDHQGAVDDEHDMVGDEARFYRTSEAYLYDLTAFAMSGTKDPYLRVLKSLVPRGGRLLDFGCGIGSDGLKLLDAGYRVEFADFDNPSTRYLRWRLRKRERSARVFDLDRDQISGGYDAVYCFDVIEHVDDPFAFLSRLEQLGLMVVINFLEPLPADTHLHRPLPINELVEHAARKGRLLHYRKYHGRSHLVAYRTTGASASERLRSRMLLLDPRRR